MSQSNTNQKENALAKAEKINEVGKLHMQGKTKAEISRKLNVSAGFVGRALAEWNDYISDKAASNPDVLDNFLENIYRFDSEIDMMNSELWDTIELAKEHGVMTTKIQALRLSKDLMETRARLFQLLAPRMDSGYIERMRRVERVNGVLSTILRDTVSGCDHCRDIVWRKLQEATDLMPELAQGDEIVDGEIVEENVN